MPAKTTDAQIDASAEPTAAVEAVEPIDDGEAGALAALAEIEAANYARAHQPSPIKE